MSDAEKAAEAHVKMLREFFPDIYPTNLDRAKSHFLAGYAAAQQWRELCDAPISDTMGDQHKLLLWVADGGFDREGDICFGVVRQRHSGGIYAQAYGYSGNWKITHWMPLPKPPEAE